MFSTLLKREIIILAMFHLSSSNAFNLGKSKISSSGNGLIDTPCQCDVLDDLYCQLISCELFYTRPKC